MNEYHLCLACLLTCSIALPTQAQIIPDSTLGAETSIVTPSVEVKGDLADLIEGGAARGTNLFHSFADFNVNDGQRVYFANPVDINSILSRVTGDYSSEIFGTLGVDGRADLFLINPNGIVFGPDVSLDVAGSFYATTSEAVEMGNGVFSATDPAQSQLLSVDPNVLFWSYLTKRSGDVVNHGQIAVGGDLVLAGANLDLAAQVVGVGNVSLVATDTVKIRDTADVPFIGFAGGDLLVQGNEQVDIVALSHTDSGLFSYGDLVLRSAKTVNGDAHYFSGGNFRVETLRGDAGDLSSPIDPIIRALGDVVIDQYLGTSLHIVAGGSVTLNRAIIAAPDPGMLNIDFLRETVSLSDGTTVAIDGGSLSTLDIRAGVSPQSIGQPPVIPLTGFNPITDLILGGNVTQTPTTADISIQDVFFPTSNSLMLLTNQYKPNDAITTGNISVQSQLAPVNGSGGILLPNGSAFVDSRGDITLTDSVIFAQSLDGSNGEIVLLAEQDLTLNSPGNLPVRVIASAPVALDEPGSDIRVRATNVTMTDGAAITTSATGLGNAGNIALSARNLSINDAAEISSSTFGRGDAGNITLEIDNTANLMFGNIGSLVRQGSNGSGGDLMLTAANLNVTEGARIFTSTSGTGDAGDISLDIAGQARFDGLDPLIGFSSSGVATSVESTGVGNAGTIKLTATNLDVTNGAVLNASTLGVGNAGNIILNIRDTARFDGVESGAISSVAAGLFPGVGAIIGRGKGGNIELTAANLEVTNGAQLTAVTSGIGDAGNIILDIGNVARFDGVDSTGNRISGAGSSVNPTGDGDGGNIELRARSLEVTNGAQLTSTTFGRGNAGNITLDIDATARFDGVNPVTGLTSSAVASSVAPNGIGTGGNIQLMVSDLEVANGAQVNASTFGIGNAGNVDVAAVNLDIINGGFIGASTAGQGNAGDVILHVEETVRLDGVAPLSRVPSAVATVVDVNGVGTGGDIELRATQLFLSNGAQLSATAGGVGDAGRINLIVADGIRLNNNAALLTASRVNSGGQINIQTDGIILRNDSDILTLVGNGTGRGGNVRIVADFVVALDDSDVLAFSADGRGGAIDLSQTTLFSQNINFASEALSRAELAALDNNDRVDINATGGIESGQVSVNDASFVEDSLNELPDNLVNTETLVATSCIARSSDISSSFVITGNGSLASGPSDMTTSFILDTVQPIPRDLSQLEEELGVQDSSNVLLSIAEPTGVYQLADGRLVMGQACH